MKEGEKRRLFLHPDLGYGTTGHLPPNSLLIFDVEVVKANQELKASQDDEDDDKDETTQPTTDKKADDKEHTENEQKGKSWWNW